MRDNPFEDEANVSVSALREFAANLRKVADLQENIADAMEANGIGGASAKNLKSALGGLASLGKFTGALATSFSDQCSAKGVDQIEGAVLQFMRYLKRKSDNGASEEATKAFADAEKPPRRKRDKTRDGTK